MIFIRMNKKIIDIEVPWPPSANNNWRIARGRMVLTPSTINYKKHVSQQAYTWPRVTFDREIDINILAYPPIGKRKMDIDNILKVLLDSLQGTHLFDDDNKINKITIERKESVRGGKLEINLQGE